MKMHRVFFLLVLSLLVLGCKVPPTKIKFNDRMARANKSLLNAGKQFGATLVEALKTGDGAGLRSKMTAVDAALKKAHERFDEMLPPTNSNSGQAYLDAYLAFLSSQDKIAGKMRDIVNVMDNVQLPPNARIAQAKALQKEIATLEEGPMEKLRNAQKAFVDEHYFRTVEKYAKD